MIVYTMYSQIYDVQSNDCHNWTRKNAAIKEIARVLYITGAYKFECDYAHGRPYVQG